MLHVRQWETWNRLMHEIDCADDAHKQRARNNLYAFLLHLFFAGGSIIGEKLGPNAEFTALKGDELWEECLGTDQLRAAHRYDLACARGARASYRVFRLEAHPQLPTIVDRRVIHAIVKTTDLDRQKADVMFFVRHDEAIHNVLFYLGQPRRIEVADQPAA